MMSGQLRSGICGVGLFLIAIHAFGQAVGSSSDPAPFKKVLEYTRGDIELTRLPALVKDMSGNSYSYTARVAIPKNERSPKIVDKISPTDAALKCLADQQTEMFEVLKDSDAVRLVRGRGVEKIEITLVNNGIVKLAEVPAMRSNISIIHQGDMGHKKTTLRLQGFFNSNQECKLADRGALKVLLAAPAVVPSGVAPVVAPSEVAPVVAPSEVAPVVAPSGVAPAGALAPAAMPASAAPAE